LRGDAYPPARFADRAFEHVAHAELAPDLLHVDGLALVGKTRIAGDYEEPTDAGECGDDLLDHAVGEIFLLRIATHIGERQHRDRRLVGQRQGGAAWPRAGRGGIRRHPVGADRAGNILQCLIAHIRKGKVELARRVLLGPRRDADPAGFGQPFEPGGDIDPVAEDVAVLSDHIALVDADAEFDAAVRRSLGVARGQRRLYFAGAAQGVDDAGELDQRPSPVVLTSRPRCSAIFGSITSARSALS
jgi:hypothetical protein